RAWISQIVLIMIYSVQGSEIRFDWLKGIPDFAYLQKSAHDRGAVQGVKRKGLGIVARVQPRFRVLFASSLLNWLDFRPFSILRSSFFISSPGWIFQTRRRPAENQSPNIRCPFSILRSSFFISS